MNKLTKFAMSTALVMAVAVPSVMASDDEKRTVAAFDKVALMGSMDMNVKVGGKRSVTVYGPSDLLAHLETYVEDDTLKVRYERDMKWKRAWNNSDVRVEVTIPSLTGAAVKGSGDIEVNKAKGDKFWASVMGSGDLTASDFKFTSVSASVKGSGDIMIDGSCDDVSVSVLGSGDVSAEDLKCENADVNVKGSGDVAVHASKSAKARIYGSGDVHVSGNPSNVEKKVKGSGDIHT